MTTISTKGWEDVRMSLKTGFLGPGSSFPGLSLWVVTKWAPHWPLSARLFSRKRCFHVLGFFCISGCSWEQMLMLCVAEGFVSCPLVRCHGDRVVPSHARQRSSSTCCNHASLLLFCFLFFLTFLSWTELFFLTRGNKTAPTKVWVTTIQSSGSFITGFLKGILTSLAM